MATDKKSFLLYADLIHMVRKMNTTDAGELFLIILEYVNDNDPSTDNTIVDLTFEHIKQQLKRDLVKYEGKRKQWSEAGKASAKAKKDKKLKDQQTLTDVEDRSTESTVSVNDSVSVSVNDISILDNKDKPTYEEFERYALEVEGKLNFEIDLDQLKLKYESWNENNWYTGGKNSRAIKNWKTTLLNTMKYLKKEKDSGKKEKRTASEAWRELGKEYGIN